MTVFADTSGLFALLVRNDFMHAKAKANFEYFTKSNTRLVTSSYVVLETITLLQRRVGLEAAVSFTNYIIPLLEIVWVNEYWHGRAVDRLRMENSRAVSLTDCLSFEIMEAMEICVAFTFDRHFIERGFETAEQHKPDEV